ncbi:MAG: CHASE2 domain-containing protein [Pseudomonadota bacterium]
MKAASWARPVLVQWAWLLGALLAGTTLVAIYDVFWRADLAIYDAALPTGPAPGDVVIVAADDASIAALGRWPWPREWHAQLLDRLRAAGARAVAFDVVFTEPDTQSPQGDAALAESMRRGPPTVLPLLVEMPRPASPLRELLPIPILADAAAAVGHAHLELDRDGVGRSVFLREGLGAPHRSHLMLALLEHAPGLQPPVLRGLRHPDLAGAPAVWVRDYRMYIPFLGPPGHFTQLSYVDVLRGRVPSDALRDKLVLVGVTAQGVGDAYPTPRSGHGVAMPGVEVAANALQAIRSGTYIRPLPLPVAVLFALIPIIIVALGFLRFTPRQSLLLTVLVWLATLGASLLVLRVAGWWWPPTAALAALLVIYPLWSWRRLEATQAYLEEELARLTVEPFPFLVPAPRLAESPRFADVVERRIHVVRQAVQRSRDVRRLFSDTINGLPDATLLADASGRIVIANPAAAQLFRVAEHGVLEGSAVDSQLFQRVGDVNLRFARLAQSAPETVEAVLQDDGRNVLVRTVPFFDGTRTRVGTIIGITDITELRAAQREREDVLRFLSHDMKTPASSLLGLAQLQRDPKRALPPAELSQRLDLLAQRLLTLVDGFVALARAESADPRVFEEFDLRDAVQDAYDEIWAAARARAVPIEMGSAMSGILIHGDRSLVARAIGNLLSNALKFSPEGSSIRVDCEARGGGGLVRVADCGPGIAPEARALLFHRFARRLHDGDSDPGGAGLGLAFVRVVAEKHGGRAWMESGGSGGAIFCLALAPAPREAPAS